MPPYILIENKGVFYVLKVKYLYRWRPLKKRCRIPPAGGLGVSPSFKKSPKTGGYRGLINTISAFSDGC